MAKPNDTHVSGSSTLPTDTTGLTGSEAPAGKLIVAAGDLVDDAFPLPAQTRCATSTLTNVTASASSQQALASTPTRKRVAFYNDSASYCNVKFGTTASGTSFTKRLAPYEFWDECDVVYTGRVDVIHATATGTLRITELTA